MLNSFVASKPAFLLSLMSRAGHEVPAHALRGGSPSTGMKTAISSSRSESASANPLTVAAGAFVTCATFAAVAAHKRGPGQKAGNMRSIRAAVATRTTAAPNASRLLAASCAMQSLVVVLAEPVLQRYWQRQAWRHSSLSESLTIASRAVGTIPLRMLDELDLSKDIVGRQVRKMTMISPNNKEVQIGQTLKEDEFIGMVRRGVMDKYMRARSAKHGATLINGLMLSTKQPEQPDGSYIITYNDFGNQEGNARKGVKTTLEVYMVIGSDGANSRLAKEIGAGDYEYAIALQERMRIPEGKMEYYKERAEMYVCEDVYPDFYGWVSQARPRCSWHHAVCKGFEFMD